MNDFAIGDTVQVAGPRMRGNVGTVVFIDVQRGRVLVRFGPVTQDFFSPGELEHFRP
uniref:KOW domain-containing protein n=1 Tax=Neobacillus citreus TaxID=2833578 RepID=A0A942Y9R8_9BACI